MDQSLNTPLSNLIDKPDLEKLIKLLKEQKVRLIVEPDSYTTLNKTIEEFKRELNKTKG